MAELMIEDAERLPDESDRASVIEGALTAEAVRRTLDKIEKAPEDFDGVHCVDCLEPIPEARLKTGAFRDISCQQRHESKCRQHRSHYE